MINSKAQVLIDNFEAEPKKKRDLLEPGITVSRTVSAAAVLYESARNAVEFRADHLIRRAAIERIIKRRLITRSSGNNVAESLVRELLWARYLENGSVPNAKVEEIQRTIDKYVTLKNEVSKLPQSGDFANWLIGVASCEIEKKLAPAPNREALINFVFQSLKDKIVIENEPSPKNNDIQVYIAVHRAYAISDEPIIRFQLFLTYFPNWIDGDTKMAVSVAPSFPQVFHEIESQLNHPAKDKLRRFIKSECAPFFVIRDMAEQNPSEFSKILSDDQLLVDKAKDDLVKRYLETKAKLQRAAKRSIVYIFLTKMVFALLIELPYDIIMKATNNIAILINSLFPPALMFIVTAGIGMPDGQNTEKVVEKIKEYVYGSQSNERKVKISLKKNNSLMFTIVYFLTFLLIFGAILKFLDYLNFSIVSKTIFLFFVSVVSFFGYRVRLDSKDYVIKEKESAITPIVDFFFLPILRVGQWLSGELAQINFLIFFLDFIIEAPFKAFFKVIEEWLHFLRTKKEEIIS